MIKTSFSNNSAQIRDKLPYKELYIYYLKGHLPVNREPHRNGFLGNWEEDAFSFLFFSKPSLEIVEHLTDSTRELELIDTYEMTYEDWQGKSIEPIRCAGFHIVPPWIDTEFEKDEIPVILDPGLVFGNGTHPTTQDCIRALKLCCYSDRINKVIDIGTGTGLLAIVAAKLGCDSVIGVDLNHLAVKTASNNVKLNQLHNKVLMIRGNAENFIDLPSDLMISNIHYDVMKKIIGSKAFLRNKYFILSGLLRSEARLIGERLSTLSVKILRTWQHDGIWHTFYGKVGRDNPVK